MKIQWCKTKSITHLLYDLLKELFILCKIEEFFTSQNRRYKNITPLYLIVRFFSNSLEIWYNVFLVTIEAKKHLKYLHPIVSSVRIITEKDFWMYCEYVNMDVNMCKDCEYSVWNMYIMYGLCIYCMECDYSVWIGNIV